MKPDSLQQFKYPALAALCSVLLYIAPWVAPVLGTPISVACPLPLIMLYRTHGLEAGRIALGISLGGALLAGLFLADSLFTGFAFLFYGLMALALGESPHWRLPLDWGLGLAAGGGTLAIVMLFFVVSLPSGEGFAAFWDNQWQQEIAATAEMYRQMGMTAEEQAELAQVASELGARFFRIAPAVMLVVALLIAWANLIWTDMLTRRVDIKQPASAGNQDEAGANTIWHGRAQAKPPGRLYGLLFWRAPEWLVWPLIAAIALVLIMDSGALYWLAWNMLIVLTALYFLQGMAILGYWRNKMNWPLAVRLVVYFLLILNFYLALLVALAGLFDMWFNFRRLAKEQDLAAGE